MYESFQPECYIQDGVQLFRILARTEAPFQPKQLKLQVEDAYCYTTVGRDRAYEIRWLTWEDLERAREAKHGFAVVPFNVAELPAQHRGLLTAGK